MTINHPPSAHPHAPLQPQHSEIQDPTIFSNGNILYANVGLGIQCSITTNALQNLFIKEQEFT